MKLPALRRRHFGRLLVAAAFAAGCSGSPDRMLATPPNVDPNPPPHDIVSRLPYPDNHPGDTVDVLHGTSVPDPYRWLERLDGPGVTDWLEAQDTLARGELGKLPERDAIAARLKELFYVDTLSAPVHRGNRYFYRRRHATKEKAIVYWKEGKDGEERVLLDPNTWSDDGSVSLKSYSIAWDGKKVAYTVSENNSDEATLYVMDVATGDKSKTDVIEGAKYAYPSWTPDGAGFYYTWLPTDPAIETSERPGYAEVRFHRLGVDPKKDAIVRERTGDPSRFIGADISRDGRLLILTVYHGWTGNEVYFKDVKAGQKDWTPLATGAKAHYSPEAHEGRLYVSTDEDAPHWRMFRVDPKRPQRAAWEEIVAERPDATLEGFSVLGGRLALNYLKRASSRVEIHELDGKLVRELPLPGVGTVGGPMGRSDEDEAYFLYESFTTPAEIHSLSIASGATQLYSKVDVPIDPTPYEVTQELYPSKDGTEVSMFLVKRKDTKKDGKNRVLLYGYGGFQTSETPGFIASIYVWLERGGIYAVPNLRGGGEYGEQWHRDGMLDKKQNVFDDFIGAAEYLVREGYTQPKRLAIYGGSNGGLLMGAVTVQRPDLFGAVICSAPLLDMVRYHLFGSGKTWTSEYGSADDPAQFRTLFAYSPYHHVTAKTAYPPFLMMTADSDDRVDPLHARKFTAALQDASTGGPVLLRVEKNSGHGGADMLKAEVQKSADRYAFALFHTRGDD